MPVGCIQGKIKQRLILNEYLRRLRGSRRKTANLESTLTQMTKSTRMLCRLFYKTSSRRTNQSENLSQTQTDKSRSARKSQSNSRLALRQIEKTLKTSKANISASKMTSINSVPKPSTQSEAPKKISKNKSTGLISSSVTSLRRSRMILSRFDTWPPMRCVSKKKIW